MNKLMIVYEKLNAHYGEQHWWPANTFIELALGAILVQNTQWNQVKKSLNNLGPILNEQALELLEIEKLKLLIAPSGFASRKALTIKNFLQWFKRYDYDISKIKILDKHIVKSQLLAISGIGLETADSILLYGLEMPFFVVDTYLKRLFRRVGLPFFTKNESYQNYIHENLEENLDLYKQFHALIVSYGKDLNTIFKRLVHKDPLYSLRSQYIQYHESHLDFLSKKDPTIKKLITSYGWVYREALPSPYHAVIYAITGQLVSAKMAEKLYVRFFEKFPTIDDVKKATITEIKSIGLTYKRAEYIYKLVQLIVANELDLCAIENMPINDAIKLLSSLPGIGVWSAKIILMHGYQKLDITMYEDLGLRKAINALYDIPRNKKSFDELMTRFSPYRTVASIFLWEFYHRLTDDK